MSDKAPDDIEVIGRNRMPDSLRRDLIAPKSVPKDPVAARIFKLSVLHPGTVEPRFDDLDRMGKATLNKLLEDIEEVLELR